MWTLIAWKSESLSPIGFTSSLEGCLSPITSPGPGAGRRTSGAGVGFHHAGLCGPLWCDIVGRVLDTGGDWHALGLRNDLYSVNTHHGLETVCLDSLPKAHQGMLIWLLAGLLSELLAHSSRRADLLTDLPCESVAGQESAVTEPPHPGSGGSLPWLGLANPSKLKQRFGPPFRDLYNHTDVVNHIFQGYSFRVLG